jgi:hypothetical protein
MLTTAVLAAHVSAESTGAKSSSVSIVFGYGTISTRVTPTEANPASVSMIWSLDPVMPTPRPSPSATLASPGSTKTPIERSIEPGSRPIDSQIGHPLALEGRGRLC